MKGLLLKDWYMIPKYCKAYLLIAALYICVSLFSNDNLFFMYYPCIICGMIPVTLLSYDERSHWVQYSGTMPYTKVQIVSEKYIIGLLCQLVLAVLMGIVQAVKMQVTGIFSLGSMISFVLFMLAISTFACSIPLPFIFKLGVEKGRIAYFVMIGFVTASGAVASNLLEEQAVSGFNPGLVLLILIVTGFGLYALSWLLSIRFFEKREIH